MGNVTPNVHYFVHFALYSNLFKILLVGPSEGQCALCSQYISQFMDRIGHVIQHFNWENIRKMEVKHKNKNMLYFES